MVFLFTTFLFHFALFFMAPLAALGFGGMVLGRAVCGNKMNAPVVGRMIMASLLIALVVCVLLALGGVWIFHDFQGPDGDPPSG